jgi:hypothetical protein
LEEYADVEEQPEDGVWGREVLVARSTFVDFDDY